MNAFSTLFKKPIRVGFSFVALIVVLALSTIAFAPPAWSQDGGPPPTSSETEGGTASSAGMGAAAALSTLIYAPIKAAFAIGGGLVGGLTYLFTGFDDQPAKKVWNTSLYGTYIITPDHLRGDKPIRFLGVPDQPDTTVAQPEPVR